MTLTPDELVQLETVLADATPGPWTIEREGGPGVLVCDDVGDSVCRVSGNESDALLIVEARNAFSQLLAVAKLATDLTHALDGVLGTNSDEPGFEEKWDLAEATCDRAREVLGMTKGNGGEDAVPHVCPGCHAVNAPCAPGCIDAEVARERDEPENELEMQDRMLEEGVDDDD